MSALLPRSAVVKSLLASEDPTEQKEGRQRVAPIAKRRLEGGKNQGMRIEKTGKGFRPYFGLILKNRLHKIFDSAN